MKIKKGNSRFRAYPEYKETNIRWIGNLPKNWDVSKLKYLLLKNEGGVWGDPGNKDNGIPVLRSTEITVNGEWDLSDPEWRVLPEDDIQDSILMEGDLLVTKSSGSALHLGKTALVNKRVESLKCGFSNFMQRLRTNIYIIPKYLYFILNTQIGREQINYYGSTTTGLANINTKVLNELNIPIPPKSEQHKIIALLENETKRVEDLIEKQERLVELLEEKRTALISHSVTKGLDPDVEMKDSGVDWLGKIPKHWDLSRLKFTCKINPSKQEVSKIPENTPVSFLPMEYIGEDGELILEEDKQLDKVFDGYTYFRNQDVIVAKITPCFENGKGAYCIELTNNIGFGTTELHVLRSFPSYFPKYIYYITKSYPFRKLGEATMYGAAGQKRVAEDFIKNFEIGYPDLDEQKSIINELDNEMDNIDKLIQKINSSINILEEYRISLISAAVTGKIDVRDQV